MKKIIFFAVFLISLCSVYSQDVTLGLFTERSVTSTFTGSGLSPTNVLIDEMFNDGGTDGGTNVIEVSSLSDNNTQAFFNYNPRLDMSAYTSYHISLRSTSTDATLIRLEDDAGIQANLDPATYGFVNDGAWHSLTIPLSDISAAALTIDLSKIKNLFIVKTTSPRNVPFDFSNYIYYIDDVYLSGPPILGLFTERSVTGTFTGSGLSPTNVNTDEMFNDAGTDGGTNVIEVSSLSDNNTQAFFNYNPRLDMSAYTSYHISLRSTSTDATLIRLEDESNVQANLDPATYGFVNDGAWHSLTIPLSDVSAAAPTIDLSKIKNLFIVKTTSPRNVPFDFSNYIYYIDDVYLSSELLGNEWTGATSSDWSTGSNWSLGTVPVATENVMIPEVVTAPVIGFDTTAYALNLTIMESEGINIMSGGALLVSGDSTGSITYNLTIGDTNWHLVSSPVVGETYDDSWVSANNIATGTAAANRGISFYDNTTDADGDWIYFQAGSSSSYISGTGYSLLRSMSGDYGFTGVIENSDVTIPITKGAAATNSWNLIGNPFPSYISVGDFLTVNADALTDENEAVYIWDGSSYTEITTGYIHPGQAFFVNSNEVTTTVSVTKQMLSGQTGVAFLKSNETSISLSIADQDVIKETTINYLEGKTTGLDPRFDVGAFTGVANSVSKSLNIFTQLVENNQGVNFVRQGLPNSNYDAMIIPVGVEAAAGKEIVFTIKTQNLPEEINVYVEDKELNTFTRLDEADASYKVVLTEKLNGVGRFYLHTTSQKSLSTDDSTMLTGITIYKLDESTLKVKGLPDGNTTIKLFNILGRELINTSINTSNTNEVSLTSLTSGVYVVQLVTEEGKLTKKIILE